MSAEPRFEYKYLLDTTRYMDIRNSLRAFAALDRFSRLGGGRYFVRSLYFDTSDYRAYREKMAGDYGRVKLRLRSYFPAREQAEFICVELKTRQGPLITKFARHVPPGEYDAFISGGSWDRDRHPVTVEFERLFRLRCLRPRVLVDYDREAFVPRDLSPVRITFDHRVRVAAADTLYPDAPNFRSREPHRVIMEIKTASVLPSWLRRLGRRHGFKAEPNSKYAAAVEQTQAGIFI